MNTLQRQYIPAIGARVKLRAWQHYSEIPSVAMWAWFTVRKIGTDYNASIVTLEHYNAGDTGQTYDVPLDWIEPPIGWKSQYTIYCKPDQAQTIITNWFARGIVVRANHCIGDSAGSTFQPADNSPQPHWKYLEVSDSVPAELCAQVFRIVAVEEEEIGSTAETKMFDPTCKHCSGTGRRSLTELAVIRNQSTAKLKELMLLPDEPYKISDKLHLDNYNASDETFDCHCHYGMFRKLGRTRRAKLIQQWASEGWTTKYLPYAGGYWPRTRETIVHDWQ